MQCYICSKSCDYDHFNRINGCVLYDNIEARHDADLTKAEASARKKILEENQDLTEEQLNIKMSATVAQDDAKRRQNDAHRAGEPDLYWDEWQERRRNAVRPGRPPRNAQVLPLGGIRDPAPHAAPIAPPNPPGHVRGGEQVQNQAGAFPVIHAQGGFANPVYRDLNYPFDQQRQHGERVAAQLRELQLRGIHQPAPVPAPAPAPENHAFQGLVNQTPAAGLARLNEQPQPNIRTRSEAKKLRDQLRLQQRMRIHRQQQAQQQQLQQQQIQQQQAQQQQAQQQQAQSPNKRVRHHTGAVQVHPSPQDQPAPNQEQPLRLQTPDRHALAAEELPLRAPAAPPVPVRGVLDEVLALGGMLYPRVDRRMEILDWLNGQGPNPDLFQRLGVRWDEAMRARAPQAGHFGLGNALDERPGNVPRFGGPQRGAGGL